MAQNEDIRLPQDTLGRALTPAEVEEVSGGVYVENSVKPDTSQMVTGCNPPKGDPDWD
jgi:hypothetical protein